jgi:hypothetical protein
VDYYWKRATTLLRRIAIANERGWHRAAWQLFDDLPETMLQLQRHAGTAHSALVAHANARFVPNPSEVFRDLLALESEFEEVEVDLKSHTIAVTTDAIVLEEVGLGPFKVRLDWEDRDSPQPYRVIALDPNPASCNKEVTHPHVNSETLCEGTGRQAIRSALAQGRLYDFFMLVSRILHTYGDSSPYVRLEDWNGNPCSGCGASTSEDDRYHCQHCDDVLCDECSVSCPCCEEIFCHGCLLSCSGCGRRLCRSCLRRCANCGRKVCGKCLRGNLCGTCHEQQPKDDEHDPSGIESEVPTDGEACPSAAADAHCLGEALVPA